MRKGCGLLISSLIAVLLPANGQAQNPASKTYVLKAYSPASSTRTRTSR